MSKKYRSKQQKIFETAGGKTRHKIAWHLEINGPCRIGEIAAATRESIPVTSIAARQLAEHGLIKKKKNKTETICELTPLGHELLKVGV